METHHPSFSFTKSVPALPAWLLTDGWMIERRRL